MIERGRHPVVSIGVDAVDYEAAVKRIVDAGAAGRSLAVAAVAVHSVVTAALDREHRYRLNALDLVVPDGQPIRWALRLSHGIRLSDRVYGPTLMLHVCAAAAERQLPVYLYGSATEVLEPLAVRLGKRFPGLVIAGSHSGYYRPLSEDEETAVLDEIRASGARILFVGLGCPRQEIWLFENRDRLSMPMLAVGAAFDLHAGLRPQAPPWMQDHGLEWLFRLCQEPRRLWRRYLLYNPLFVVLLALQRIGLSPAAAAAAVAPRRPVRCG